MTVEGYSPWFLDHIVQKTSRIFWDRLVMPPGRARLRRALIKPEDFRQLKCVILGSVRLTNTEALPGAAVLANARPKEIRARVIYRKSA